MSGVTWCEYLITSCLLVVVQFNSFNPELVQSTPQVRSDLFRRKMEKALLTDFFGSVRNIELLNSSTPSKEKKGEGQSESDMVEEEEGHSGVRDMAKTSGRPVLDVVTHIGKTNVVSSYCLQVIDT